MKKLFLVAALLASFTASAADITLGVGRNSHEQDVIRATVDQPVLGLGSVGLSAERAGTSKAGSYAVAATASTGVQVGPVGLGVFGGPAAVQAFSTAANGKTTRENGYGFVYGVGAKLALSKNVGLVAEAHRFQGKSAVVNAKGNTVTVGLNATF